MMVLAFSAPQEVLAQTKLTPVTDTLTNADTTYLSLSKISGYYNSVAIQVNASKISGTVGGSAVVQGSVDGTNYIDLPTAVADSMSLTNGSSSHIWAIESPPYPYYRVKIITSGTQKSAFQGYWLGKRE